MTPSLPLVNAPPVDADAPGTRRQSPLRQVDAAVQRSVWNRDGHVCQFCGFHSLRYLEVVVLGGNARDVDHMLSACQFCHQCWHLPTVTSMRSGVLIWLPELTQTDLNHVAREIYLARITRWGTVRANKALDALMARREAARERLGTDDPNVLAQRFAEAPGGSAGVMNDELRHGIRLMPLDRRILQEDDLEFNQFPQVLAYWRSGSGPYHGEREFAWIDRLEKALADGGAALSAPGFGEAVAEPMPSYAALGAQLLRDSAHFFRNMAAQKPDLDEQLLSNAQTYVQVADLLEHDPSGHLAPQPEGPAAGLRIADVAARLLEDSANFFEALGEQNPPLKEQMDDNASTYRGLAHWVRTDPLGRPEG